MLTRGEDKFMKLLKIDEGKGLFTNDGVNYSNAIDITKEDILKMLEFIYNNEVEFEKCENDKEIYNNAEKIIYDSIYSKLITFNSNKDTLKSQIENENGAIISKYKFDSQE